MKMELNKKVDVNLRTSLKSILVVLILLLAIGFGLVFGGLLGLKLFQVIFG